MGQRYGKLMVGGGWLPVGKFKDLKIKKFKDLVVP
jgi:hypothetical protein